MCKWLGNISSVLSSIVQSGHIVGSICCQSCSETCQSPEPVSLTESAFPFEVSNLTRLVWNKHPHFVFTPVDRNYGQSKPCHQHWQSIVRLFLSKTQEDTTRCRNGLHGPTSQVDVENDLTNVHSADASCWSSEQFGFKRHIIDFFREDLVRYSGCWVESRVEREWWDKGEKEDISGECGASETTWGCQGTNEKWGVDVLKVRRNKLKVRKRSKRSERNISKVGV